MTTDAINIFQPVTVRVEYDEDGTRRHYLVGEWPVTTLIDTNLIKDADETLLWQKDDEIHFQLTDTSAVYRFVKSDMRIPETWEIELVSIGDAVPA